MCGRQAIIPGTAAGYGLEAAMSFGPDQPPSGWVAIGGDMAAAMCGSAAAGGSEIHPVLGLGLQRIDDDTDSFAAAAPYPGSFGSRRGVRMCLGQPPDW